MDYPEHEKLAAVKTQSQICGEFLDWLGTEKNLTLCRLHEGHYFPSFEGIQDLLCEFFEIDKRKLEAEKREMLREIRSHV